ncbi:hypothetical protein LTR95_009094 [Oleoguttula sp. CCFEE 5521]
MPADRGSQIETPTANPALNGNVLHANAKYVDFIVGIRRVSKTPAALKDPEITGGTHFSLVIASELSPPDGSAGPPPRSPLERRFSDAFNEPNHKEQDRGSGAKEITKKKPKWSVAKKRARDEACKIARLADGLDSPSPDPQLPPQIGRQRKSRRKSRRQCALRPSEPKTGPPLSSELHIYTDGSMIEPKYAALPRALGCGVAWRVARGWEDFSWAVGYECAWLYNNYAESPAIDEALDIAFNMHSSSPLTKITLWTDSQCAQEHHEADWIAACRLYKSPECKSMYLMRTLIDGDVQIDANLIKGHNGILGNTYADNLARLGSERSIAYCHSLEFSTACDRLCFDNTDSLNKLSAEWKPMMKTRRAYEAFMRSKEMAAQGAEQPMVPITDS